VIRFQDEKGESRRQSCAATRSPTAHVHDSRASLSLVWGLNQWTGVPCPTGSDSTRGSGVPGFLHCTVMPRTHWWRQLCNTISAWGFVPSTHGTHKKQTSPGAAPLRRGFSFHAHHFSGSCRSEIARGSNGRSQDVVNIGCRLESCIRTEAHKAQSPSKSSSDWYGRQS
jgi:hypothetical protein